MINGYQAGRRQSRRLAPLREERREKSYPTSHFLWGTESHEVQGSMTAIGAKKEAFSDTQMLLHTSFTRSNIPILKRKSSSKHNGFAL